MGKTSLRNAIRAFEMAGEMVEGCVMDTQDNVGVRFPKDKFYLDKPRRHVQKELNLEFGFDENKYETHVHIVDYQDYWLVYIG